MAMTMCMANRRCCHSLLQVESYFYDQRRQLFEYDQVE